MQKAFGRMLARIVVIEPDMYETEMDVGYLDDRLETLRLWYDTPPYKSLKEQACPHYIDVEYPVEYLEYCLQLK